MCGMNNNYFKDQGMFFRSRNNPQMIIGIFTLRDIELHFPLVREMCICTFNVNDEQKRPQPQPQQKQGQQYPIII